MFAGKKKGEFVIETWEIECNTFNFLIHVGVKQEGGRSQWPAWNHTRIGCKGWGMISRKRREKNEYVLKCWGRETKVPVWGVGNEKARTGTQRMNAANVHGIHATSNGYVCGPAIHLLPVMSTPPGQYSQSSTPPSSLLLRSLAQVFLLRWANILRLFCEWLA